MADHRLRYLLLRYYQKRASGEERDELMSLLRDGSFDGQIRDLILELIRSRDTFDKTMDEGRAEDILRSVFEEAAADEAHHPVFIDEEEEASVESGQRRSVIWGIRSYWAAAVLIGIFLGGYWLIGRGGADTFKAMTKGDDAREDVLLPGGNKALLTLWDGTVVNLENGIPPLEETPDFKIDAEKGELVYRGLSEQAGYNLLTTPLGGQYRIVLPDGSGAWLNAGSSLKFPTSFGPAARKVEVTGEVFFEVKHEKGKPFVVSLPNQRMKGEPVEIVVLGTEFNVSSYSDDPVIQTTLIKGLVEVKKGREVKLLSPGEQAEVKKLEKGESEIEVRNVDAQSVTAWKEGMFEFNGSIEVIMRQISRWYAVEIEYEGNVGEKIFAGAISRKESAAEVLKYLELTGGIRFETEGSKIKVKAI